MSGRNQRHRASCKSRISWAPPTVQYQRSICSYWTCFNSHSTLTFDKQNSLHNIVNQFKQVKMWSVDKRSFVSRLFSLPCSQERLPEPCRACLVWICEMPANTNEWTTRITDGDPEPTAEHTRDTLACHRYLSIGHAGGGKRVTISFSYLTLDFLLLTQIKLLGRSGRGRKATRSRKRLCALHSCWRTTRKLIMKSSSYHANVCVTSTKLICSARPAPNGRKELALQLRPWITFKTT